MNYFVYVAGFYVTTNMIGGATSSVTNVPNHEACIMIAEDHRLSMLASLR